MSSDRHDYSQPAYRHVHPTFNDDRDQVQQLLTSAMSTSSASKHKGRQEDDYYRSRHGHAYRKKRRHGDVGSDVEDWEGVSPRNEKRDYGGKDALADFRSEIADEEARYRQHRDTVPISSDDAHRRRHRSAYGSDRRRRDRYEEEEPHPRRPRDQHYLYKETRRPVKSTSSTEDQGHAQGRTRNRSPSPHQGVIGHRHSSSKDSNPRGASNQLNEDDEAKPGGDVKRVHGSGRRGRSLSRSSTSSRASSNRSLSRGSSTSTSGSSRRHSRERKRRRTRSRSRSRDRKGRKDRKSHKDRRSRSRKKGKDREKSEMRRSALTGKKIKLKVKRDKGDDERDAKRQELLKFLNSAYE